MRGRKKKDIKMIFTVDDRLNDVETPDWAIEKLKVANEAMRNAKMPDAYYKRLGKL